MSQLAHCAADALTANGQRNNATPRTKGNAVTQNVGTADRVVRNVIGLALLGSPLAWYGLENIHAWGYVGLAPLLSGLFGTCPLYSFMGWSTDRA